MPASFENQPASIRAWVLYDRSCEFCSRLVMNWSGTLRRRGLFPMPLQTPWIRQRLDLEESELMRDLHVVPRSGSVVRGADAYRYIFRRIWFAYPLYLLSRLPLFKQIFNAAYRFIAGRRNCL